MKTLAPVATLFVPAAGAETLFACTAAVHVALTVRRVAVEAPPRARRSDRRDCRGRG